MKFIIEHLEPFISEWCLIEYENISNIVGKENLIITKLLKKDSQKNAKHFWGTEKQYFSRVNKLKHLAELHEESVLELPLKNTCLLEPQTNKILASNDNFDYFIFGGILGDHPERGRTEKYLTSKLPGKLINPETRNLGNMQMSTDTAVLVTKIIARDKIDFNKIKFIDKPEIELKQGKISESIILPYRYVKENNKPIISKKLLEYLKNKEDL